jgi:RNA polymerase-binding transcription factor DksA
MNGTDVEQHKAVLLAVRHVIVQKSLLREASWVNRSNKVERDCAMRLRALENERLKQVDGALKRIEDGEFGTCLKCEEPISSKRLAAVPWATCCLRCQELEDSRHATEAAEPTLAA